MVPKVLIAMVVAVVVGLGASPAAAGKDAFVRFVADLAASSDAAAAWFADCDVLLTPGGQVRRPCALTMADLAGGAAGATLKVTSNKVAHLYASQYLAREATVEARVGRKLVATFRVVEISGFGNPDNPTGGWAPLAVHWVRLITDKDAAALAAAGALPEPPVIKDVVQVPAGDDQDASDAASLADDLERGLRGRADLRELLGYWLEDGTILAGSAPRQRLTGARGGKAVQGWKLDLAQRGGLDITAHDMVGFAITIVTGKTRGKVPQTYSYPTLVVYTQGLTEAGSLISGPRVVSFGLVR